MGSSSKLVLLCGYYGYGNGGDEALLATLLQMLPESVTPVVMTATPAETAEQHQVETCDRNSPLSVLKLMTRAEGFIWGGGSLIQDSTSWLSPLYYILWMSIAQLLRLKTVAWAQGIGPLRRPVIRAIASWSFGHCTARSTRDTGSSKLLDQWRLDYRIAPDPVWAMAGHVPPSLGPTSGSGTELNVKTVAVVLRAHPLLTKDRLNTLIQAFIQFQAETQAHLLLLPFQRSQDYDIARTIEARLSGNRSLLMCDNPRQLK
ncbi:MAG: polysaccharide pyruvyl transferase CsaB, partial [Cyanobacteria bacterium P01_F01_bin.42]